MLGLKRKTIARWDNGFMTGCCRDGCWVFGGVAVRLNLQARARRSS